MTVEQEGSQDQSSTEDQSLESVVNSLIDDSQNEVKDSNTGKPQPDPENQGEDSDEVDELDFDGMPNGKIRYDKVKKQKIQLQNENAQLKIELAKLQGAREALSKESVTDSKDDPTEYMSDTERILYENNQKMVDVLSKLTAEVSAMKNESTVGKLEKKEEVFFKNNPELQQRREEVVSEVVDFLNDKPELKPLLKKGTISFQQLYSIVKADRNESSTKTRVQNSDSVFSGNKRQPSSSGETTFKGEDIIKKARSVLNDPNSTNKSEATNILIENITNDILSNME